MDIVYFCQKKKKSINLRLIHVYPLFFSRVLIYPLSFSPVLIYLFKIKSYRLYIIDDMTCLVGFLIVLINKQLFYNIYILKSNIKKR